MKLGEVGPLDFLFCKKCDRHLTEPPSFKAGDIKLSCTSRRDRVSASITVEPLCPDCGGPLIQKYVSVTVEIKP